jgi:hypothetical protein
MVGELGMRLGWAGLVWRFFEMGMVVVRSVRQADRQTGRQAGRQGRVSPVS